MDRPSLTRSRIPVEEMSTRVTPTRSKLTLTPGATSAGARAWGSTPSLAMTTRVASEATAWGSDLTEEFVRLNSMYTT